MSNRREQLLTAGMHGALPVRDMRGIDLSQVLLIENNAQVSPWSRLSFEESLTKDYFCRVIEMLGGDSDELVAYHVSSEIFDELHILNVVAAPQFQGLGLGHMLMEDIVNFAKTRNLSKLFLEVRASNEAAQSLYSKWQFRQIAIRKQYYRVTSANGLREDALIFLREL